MTFAFKKIYYLIALLEAAETDYDDAVIIVDKPISAQEHDAVMEVVKLISPRSGKLSGDHRRRRQFFTITKYACICKFFNDVVSFMLFAALL